jgi:hypothetical protein
LRVIAAGVRQRLQALLDLKWVQLLILPAFSRSFERKGAFFAG